MFRLSSSLTKLAVALDGRRQAPSTTAAGIVLRHFAAAASKERVDLFVHTPPLVRLAFMQVISFEFTGQNSPRELKQRLTHVAKRHGRQLTWCDGIGTVEVGEPIPLGQLKNWIESSGYEIGSCDYKVDRWDVEGYFDDVDDH